MAKAQQERRLDSFNQRLRADPAYRQFLQSMGVNPDGPIRLSSAQKKRAERWVEQRYGDLGKGMEIDSAGNANQNEGFGKQAKRWGPIVGGAALTAFGIPGVMPGLLGGGGAGAGTAAAGAGAGSGAAGGGALAAGSIPTSLAMFGPGAVASQGVSAGLPLALGGSAGAGLPSLVGSTVPGLEAAVPASIASQNVSQGGGSTQEQSGGGGWGRDLVRQLASPQGAASLMAVIAGLKGSGGGGEATEEMRRLQRINEARMRRADPLHEVAVNLAFGRLPTNYRQGVNLPRVPLPE